VAQVFATVCARVGRLLARLQLELCRAFPGWPASEKGLYVGFS
jgi:hypothetical protein